MGERLLCKQQVTGSRPVRSIRNDTTVGLAPAVVFRFGVHGFRPHPNHAPRNPMPPSDCPLGLIPQPESRLAEEISSLFVRKIDRFAWAAQ